MSNLFIKETFVNQTKGHQFDQTRWYETYHTDTGSLFKSLQREYGKATAMYVDKDGKQVKIGWVFEKRMRYEDSRDPKDTYIREVWVEVSKVNPEQAMVYVQAPQSPWERAHV